MNRLLSLLACLIFVSLLFSPPALFAGEGDTLTGLLRGTYGMQSQLVCVEVKQNEMGLYPDLPHFEMQEDGTWSLLVEAETSSYQAVGTWEFDGNGSFIVPEANMLAVTHQRVSPGNTALMPLNPLSCEGTYSVAADRRIQGEANCAIPLGGDFPLTLNVGPLRFSGFIGTNPQFVLLAAVEPELFLATITSGGQVITSYQSYCTQSVTMVKIDPEPIHFAQFGNGGGLVSDIVLTNPTAVPAGGSINFTDDNGAPLAVGLAGGGEPQSELDFSVDPLGAVTISTDGQGTATPGSAQVTANQELGGVIRFTIPGIGVAGVGRSDPLSGFIAPVRRTAGGLSTGIALENVEEFPVTILLSLRDESGAIVAESTLEEFPARGHLSQFIEQIFPGADTDDFRGTVTVTVAGGRIAGTAIELDVSTNRFTTLPVTPLR